MKKYLLIVFTVLMFFVFDNSVYAAINSKNTEIQCTYANRMSIGFRRNIKYDASGGREITNKLFLNKNKSAAVIATVSLDVTVQEELYSQDAKSYFQDAPFCPENIYYWVRREKDKKADDANGYEGIYEVSSISSTALLGTHNTWHTWLTGATENDYELVALTLKEGSNNAFASNEAGGIRYSLVAERLSFVDEILTENYGPVFELVSTDEQATNTKKYAQFFKYHARRGNIRYLQIGNVITQIKESISIDGEDKEICILESYGEQNPESSESGYFYNSSRHHIQSVSSSGECPTGYAKYKKSTRVCDVDPNNSAGSFCDKFPNIAFQLANVINIMQILAPALVIILSGIEIGRIVVAGNIEEELPKRKKSLIIRAIILVVFLFLKLIVSLIISLANGVSINDVGCLFNGGVTETSGSELSCYDESDD